MITGTNNNQRLVIHPHQASAKLVSQLGDWQWQGEVKPEEFYIITIIRNGRRYEMVSKHPSGQAANDAANLFRKLGYVTHLRKAR